MKFAVRKEQAGSLPARDSTQRNRQATAPAVAAPRSARGSASRNRQATAPAVAVRTYLFAAALSLGGASIPALVAAPAVAAEAASGSDGAPPPELAALRKEGIALHDAARDGDEGAAESAVDTLERYLERFPKDGEAQAYLGSSYAMMGRDASSVVNKMRYTNRGLRHLDRALDAAPRDFTVRFIRARVNASLPSMFNRGEAALADMLALDAIFQASPAPAMAGWMVGIYEDLQDRAPDAGPWDERLAHARELAGGG